MPVPSIQPGRDAAWRLWRGEDRAQAVVYTRGGVTRCRIVGHHVRC
jgi:hypothetical protein